MQRREQGNGKVILNVVTQNKNDEEIKNVHLEKAKVAKRDTY